jgi:broad specificity phosphatase PhoE
VTARLRLIRHGHAAVGGPGEDHDPGLSPAGAREALALPALFAPDPPTRLIVSPLRRARETALPLAAALDLAREIEPAYGELPWREGQTVVTRSADLRRELAGNWAALDAARRHWREALIAQALSETGDVAIVTHFVAINVLVGFAQGDDRIVVTRPRNASVTEIAVAAGGLRLVRLGAQDEMLFAWS